MARPKKLKDEDYIAIEKLAKFGLTKEMIADYVDICYKTMYSDERFLQVYKRGYAEMGAKVRTTLIKKMEKDTIANIYLDKVINKTSEKYHDDNRELRLQDIEINKQKLELEKAKNNVETEYEDDGFLEALSERVKGNVDYKDLGDIHD
ncbi:MAG: hypothetical protein ACRC5T_12470 [Cetobacterium sp.]